MAAGYSIDLIAKRDRKKKMDSSIVKCWNVHYQTLEEVCIVRKCFQKGEQPDIMRASGMVLEDFRSGRIGRITLEHPED